MYFNKSPNKESTRLPESRNFSYAFLGTSVRIIQVAEKKVSQPASAAINQSKLVFALSSLSAHLRFRRRNWLFGWSRRLPKSVTLLCSVCRSAPAETFHGTSASSGHEQVSNCALEEFSLWGITLRALSQPQRKSKCRGHQYRL